MTPDNARKMKWFVGVAAAQLALVVILAVFHQSVVLTGPRFHLKVVPVDPRSLFMDQYLALAYEVETIDLNPVARDFGQPSDAAGFLVAILREDNGPVRVVRLQKNFCPRDLPRGEFCLRAYDAQINGDSVRVRFGVDRYYVPEARAESAERSLRDAGRAATPSSPKSPSADSAPHRSSASSSTPIPSPSNPRLSGIAKPCGL
jgi:uncharacterized membrane-anchored protein